MTPPPENALLPCREAAAKFALEYWQSKPDIYGPGFKNVQDLARKIVDKFCPAQPPALPDAPVRGGEEYYYDCYKCDKRFSTENLMIVDHPEEVPPRDNVRTCRTCLTDNVGADSYTLIQSSQREVTGEVVEKMAAAIEGVMKGIDWNHRKGDILLEGAKDGGFYQKQILASQKYEVPWKEAAAMAKAVQEYRDIISGKEGSHDA